MTHKIKQIHTYAIHAVLAETREQLDAIQADHDADVDGLSRKIQELQSELDALRADRLKSESLYKINIRESEEQNEALQKQLLAVQRSLTANEQAEEQFDELVDEIIADAAMTSDARHGSDLVSINSGGEESTTSLTLDQDSGNGSGSHLSAASNKKPQKSLSSKHIALSSFNGHESLASLASHGTTSSKIGDARVIARLRRQLSRSLQRMEALTNQAVIIKQSSDAVIAGVRQECEVQLEERTKNEVMLLNQIAAMDEKHTDEKSEMQNKMVDMEREITNLQESSDFYQEALRELEGTLQQLTAIGSATATVEQGETAGGEEKHLAASEAAKSAARDMFKLEESIAALAKENEELKKKYDDDMKETEQQIKWLEEENYLQQREISSLTKAATEGGDDNFSVTSGRSAISLDLHDLQGNSGHEDTCNKFKHESSDGNAREQLREMKMMSVAGGLGGARISHQGGRKPRKNAINEAGTNEASSDYMRRMHESWSPEGHFGKGGSVDGLIRQAGDLAVVEE